MHDTDIAKLMAAIAALESQRATLGDAVLELAVAPLRARLATLRRPARLQLRQVTVLFADVTGSTAMATRLHPEDTLDMLSGAVRRMAALVEGHRGRVLRFTGDGLKAAFGMEIAQEDDAARAVRAGLAILQAGREQAEAALISHGITDFAVRVGVHTGDVALGAGVEADNTAMGAAVNIAARMEQTAPPGALRISNETFNQVRGLFQVEQQPPLQVKGVEGAMQTYLVRAALDRSAASVERGLQGLSTPMVGREAELQRLHQAIASARRQRQLQALTVVGDAGLGKSRLLREWVMSLAGDPADCLVLAIRSQPDGMLRPWGLLRSLLAVQCGVADTDSAEDARRKVEDGLGPWFTERGGEYAKRQAQLIGQLSGLDFGDSPTVRGLDPRSLRDQALSALRGYLQKLGARDNALPVLLIEDLHWLDDSSLDLLQHLLAHASELPLVLVMTGRPSLLARRPDWGPTDTLMQLHPLAATQGNQLAQGLLQRMDDVPPAMMKLLTGQAEGNPYYMEELVRRLIDDGVINIEGARWEVRGERVEALRLPGTLVGLLQARLDALPPAQRQAARLASVIGHVFWDDALHAVHPDAPEALPALERAAFVRDHRHSDFEGTTERQFDHHLLHQVTYDTLLKAERTGGHGAAARWLQERTRGRGAEFLAMTGAHAERAGDTALAIDCFEQAGLEAEKRFANAAAAAWLHRALALMASAQPVRRFRLLSRLAAIADVVGDRAGQDELHVQMEALLEQHPDDEARAELLFFKALLADRRSDVAASGQWALQSVEVAERSGAWRWAAMAHAQLAWLCIPRQDYAAARTHIETGLPSASRIEGINHRAETEAQLLTLSGMVSLLLCRMDEARRSLADVLSRGEVLGSPRVQLGALDNLALVAATLGRWDEAAAYGERMRALADAIGSPNGIAMAQLRLAEAARGLGDVAAAVGWIEKSLGINRAIGYRRMEAIALRQLADLHVQLGDGNTALQCCIESRALHRDLHEAREACEVEALAALCAVHLSQPAEALRNLNVALDHLQRDLADSPANETIDPRWICHQVMVALHDERAGPLLDQLFADVQARAAEVTGADDRERLIQAVPVFRTIVAAHARRGEPADAV